MCRFVLFCFSAVCFFINVSFRAVVSCKCSLSLSVQSTQFCSLLFYCIVSASMNKIFIQNVHHVARPKTDRQTRASAEPQVHARFTSQRRLDCIIIGVNVAQRLARSRIVPVSLQPIKSARRRRACDQSTRRVTGSTCCRPEQFSSCAVNEP